MIAVLLGLKVKSDPETSVRIWMSANSGRISVRGESRVMRPFSMHWRSAMLVMSLVALASLRTGDSSRGTASAEREL